MSELRQSFLSGRWVAVAPQRGSRPVQASDGREAPSRPDRDPTCPFCPGNEDQLPGILREREVPGRPGWSVRVVPNRYPAFRRSGGEGRPEAGTGGAGPARPARGAQEVIIETARHDLETEEYGPDHLQEVFDTYGERLRWHGEEGPRRWTSLFRNYGRAAGASLEHAHAQLFVLPSAPPRARWRRSRARRYREERGRCLLCDGGGGPNLEERTVFGNDLVRAVVPWAAETPLEVWVVPRIHRASFVEAEAAERKALGLAVRDILRRVRTLRGRTAYNYVLHSEPPAFSGDPALHWFLRIRPRTYQPAGFELDSGIAINPSSPESDAQSLRKAEKGVP